MAVEGAGEGRGGAPGPRPPVRVTASLLAATAVAVVAVLAAPVMRWLLRGRGRAALADDLSLLSGPVSVAAAALVARGAAQSTSSDLARSAAGVALIMALAWVVLRMLRVVQQALFRQLSDAARRSPLWDGRAVVVQVVELGERSVQIRVLVTASDAGTLWDLRCDLREQLLDHLQAHAGPLPVIRVDGVGRSASRTPADA